MGLLSYQQLGGCGEQHSSAGLWQRSVWLGNACRGDQRDFSTKGGKRQKICSQFAAQAMP